MLDELWMAFSHKPRPPKEAGAKEDPSTPSTVSTTASNARAETAEAAPLAVTEQLSVPEKKPVEMAEGEIALLPPAPPQALCRPKGFPSCKRKTAESSADDSIRTEKPQRGSKVALGSETGTRAGAGRKKQQHSSRGVAADEYSRCPYCGHRIGAKDLEKHLARCFDKCEKEASAHSDRPGLRNKRATGKADRYSPETYSRAYKYFSSQSK